MWSWLCRETEARLRTISSFFFFFNNFFKYNSHSIKFTHSKCTILWTLVYLQSCAVHPSPKSNLEYFHYSPKKPCTRWPSPHNSPILQWATTNQLFISTALLILDISHKWSHKICGLLSLVSFTQRNISRFIHVAACISTSFIFMAPLYENTTFSLSIIDGRLGSFHLLATVNGAAMNIYV